MQNRSQKIHHYRHVERLIIFSIGVLAGVLLAPFIDHSPIHSSVLSNNIFATQTNNEISDLKQEINTIYAKHAPNSCQIAAYDNNGLIFKHHIGVSTTGDESLRVGGISKAMCGVLIPIVFNKHNLNIHATVYDLIKNNPDLLATFQSFKILNQTIHTMTVHQL